MPTGTNRCRAGAKPSLLCKFIVIAEPPAWCRLQTILKRPGAYEALRGTEDEDKDRDTDQERAHLLAPEPSSHQEGAQLGSSAQLGQQNGPGHGLEDTSQLGLGSGSQRSQRAGTSTDPSSSPSSGLEPPAAAAQGPGAPQEALEHMPEVSQVAAPNPVDAEIRMGQVEAAFQVGSLVFANEVR